ncbi:hypothetical protein [Demequina sediminis]|uniref:hypothetical protein n=1 Tax=Demequina sediminis TaxID=1930058 RepID=UPI00257407AC|nr:hypothetical protein [Demequina sediminis]
MQSHLGWTNERYDGAKTEALLDGWIWTWEGSLTALTQDEGFWVWRDGRDAVDSTLARAEMRFPDHWHTSPAALADRSRLYVEGVGMKRAARLFPQDDVEARLTLIALSTVLRFDRQEAWTDFNPYMREVCRGIDVRRAVRNLERYGYVEVAEDRAHVRFTQAYADTLADYAAHWKTRENRNRETEYEERWTAAHRRPQWVGAEREARGARWYMYALETTADLTITVNGVTEEFPTGTRCYVGISTLPEMRALEHFDASECGYNPRLHALKQAAEAVNRDHPALVSVQLESHSADEMTWLQAQQRERFLVQSGLARGLPLLNIQYTLGKDWMTGGDHTARR